jgi:hypothetical protein
MESKSKPNQSVLIEKLVEKERELRVLMLETYKNEGFSKVNLLQRSLLEIIKEQNLNENSNNSTGKTR